MDSIYNGAASIGSAKSISGLVFALVFGIILFYVAYYLFSHKELNFLMSHIFVLKLEELPIC